MQELRYTVRLLLRQRFYSLVVILILALGIGANTAVFSVLYNVVLRSLPYPESDRLVRICSSKEDRTSRIGSSIPDLLDWSQAESLELLEGYRYGRWELDQDPDRPVIAMLCRPGFFELIGSRPALGRLFSEEDLSDDSSPVALLTYDYWFSQFGGSPDVIGETFPAFLDRRISGDRTRLGSGGGAARSVTQLGAGPWPAGRTGRLPELEPFSGESAFSNPA